MTARGVSGLVGSLDLDGGAGALEGLGSLLGGLLGDLLEDGLRGAVDEVLGLLQTQRGQLTHDLDDLDLLLAGTGEDDVELVLLLLGLGGGGAARPAAATATGAAAVTSNFSSKAFTNSESSMRVMVLELREQLVLG